MEGTIQIKDNIVIHGKGKAHDRMLKNFLDRLQKKGGTLREEQCQFRAARSALFRFNDKEGMRSDPRTTTNTKGKVEIRHKKVQTQEMDVNPEQMGEWQVAFKEPIIPLIQEETADMTGTTIYIMEEANHTIENIDSSRERIMENLYNSEEEQVTKKESALETEHKPDCRKHKQYNKKASVRKKTGT